MRNIILPRPHMLFRKYHLIPNNKKLRNVISLCYNLRRLRERFQGLYDVTIHEKRK